MIGYKLRSLFKILPLGTLKMFFDSYKYWAFERIYNVECFEVVMTNIFWIIITYFDVLLELNQLEFICFSLFCSFVCLMLKLFRVITLFVSFDEGSLILSKMFCFLRNTVFQLLYLNMPKKKKILINKFLSEKIKPDISSWRKSESCRSQTTNESEANGKRDWICWFQCCCCQKQHQ